LAPLGSTALGGLTSEDLSFDGQNLLVGDFSDSRVARVDPTTGIAVGYIPIGFSEPLGLSWDGGTGIWVSRFDTSGVVYHYDASGNLLSQFTAIANSYAGGIGFDPTDSTLYVGSFSTVYHFTTGGALLGSFSTPDSRFIDGLEVRAGAAPVPEPGTVSLLVWGIVGFAMRRKYGRRLQ